MASIKYTALMLLATAGAQAQSLSFSFGDLFGQGGKQKKNYLAQIAAYETFTSELRQGYNVIKNGLSGIRDINTAELNAHQLYYQSLSQVGSPVKNNPQVQEILTWQIGISGSFDRRIDGLTDEEKNYYATVRSAILEACNQDLSDLQNLLQDGALQMSDDERLQRLSRTHAAMLDKYQFTQSFIRSAKLLVVQRQKGVHDTQTLMQLYENH